MPSLASVTDWIASYGEIYQQGAVWDGFISGLAVGFVLPVGILVLWGLSVLRRRRCRGIRIPGDGGDLIISSVAIREFMQRNVAEFRELELLGVQLRRRRDLTDIILRVNAVPGSNVKQVKEALRERIRVEAGEKLALDELLGDIHIEVQKLSASERTIARKARKVQRDEPSQSFASAQSESMTEADSLDVGSRDENGTDGEAEEEPKPLPVGEPAE